MHPNEAGPKACQVNKNMNSRIESEITVAELCPGNSENRNSSGATELEQAVQKDCEARLKRRGKRGRPKGTGRQHAQGSSPKTFRNFSPSAHILLKHLLLANQMKQTEAEIVEEALIRLALSRSNEHPQLVAYLRRSELT